MMRPQLALPFHGELIIDNFAGGGGTSTGLEVFEARDHGVGIDRGAVAEHGVGAQSQMVVRRVNGHGSLADAYILNTGTVDEALEQVEKIVAGLA